METEQKNAILAMWEKLINSMPAEIMYDKLVQYKLLTVQDYDEMNKLSTIPRKNRYIIKAIINCPSEHAFDIFIQALTSIDSITTNELAFSLKEEYQNAMPNNLKQVKTRPISNQDDWNESDWNNCLLYLAENLGNDWKKLGRRLGLRETVISDCESNNRGRIAEARIAMLLAWKSSWPDAEPSSKKKELMEALAKCKLNLLAHKISIKEW